MAILSLEKTTLAILKKFQEKSEFEKRKIVFWYDKDKTAQDEGLEEITIKLKESGIKTVILKNNFFEIKKLLEHDDRESDFLVYSLDAEREYEENWLLDIQLYSERFENSRISDVKSEIGISGHTLDKILEKHEKFFANKKRVAAFSKIFQKDWNEDKVIIGMLTVLTGASADDPREIVRKLLLGSLQEKENTIWQEITQHDLSAEFWNTVGRSFGFSSSSPTLKKLFLSFIVTHIDRTTSIELGTFKQYINRKRQSNECEIFLSSWMENVKDAKIFDEYCEQLLQDSDKQLEKSLTSVLNNHPVEDYLQAESLDIFDKNIIRTIVNQLSENGSDYCRYYDWIEKRKTKHWYSQYENIYSALNNAIHLIEKSREIEKAGIPATCLNELFKTYTDSYYLVDYFYRKFYYFYGKDSEKEILKKSIREIVEQEYRHITEKILIQWSNLISSELGTSWKIELTDAQSDFYQKFVKKILTKNDRDKVAVIISDAFRYEVAAELRERLNQNLKGTIEITALAGCLPSYTRLGMASLLPHAEITYKKDQIIVDGIDSSSLQNRMKILQKSNPDSIAVSFNDISNLKKDDARELLKGKRVVYIYHNKIDDSGDKPSSEHEVFNAAENSLADLEGITSRLSQSLNITNIIITSDHGFLYNRDTLNDAEIVEVNSFNKDKILMSNKRFIISTEDLTISNTHKFCLDSMVYANSKLILYVPYADLRFKFAGGGRNYVHGGAALQEITIPVLVYNHNRYISDLERKGIEFGTVNVKPVASPKKITSNPFKIQLLQTETVTDKREPLKCRIAVYDTSGQKVSDEKLIIADKTTDEPSDRIQEVLLTLRNDVKKGIYLLKGINDDAKAIIPDVFELPVEVDILIIDDF